MSVITMKNLLESGVHFGHQVNRWNPKMKPYIYAARNGIHIIDLKQTIQYIRTAYNVVRETILNGKDVLFVGTKKQAQKAIIEAANNCGMHYVNYHWQGGMLTNFETIKKSIVRLQKLERMEADGFFESLTKKEIAQLTKEKNKKTLAIGGIKNMKTLPGIVFVIDTRTEAIAIAEANRCNIPVIGIVDSNSDPTGIDYLIPGNDDAIRAILFYTQIIAQAVIEADKEIGLEIIDNLQNEELAINNEINTKEVAEEKEIKAEQYTNYNPENDKEIKDVQSHEEEIAIQSGFDEEQLYEN